MSADSVEHVLFECHCNKLIREDMWFSIVNCTGNFGHDLEKMNNRDRAMFILNAMNIGFIQECYYIYDCILLFIYNVYSTWIKFEY